GAEPGEVVARFEAAFARWLGAEHACFVSSGSIGLHLLYACHCIPHHVDSALIRRRAWRRA
ncbi:MAG: hypothetical protein HGA83_08395, partial [Bacteroidales bacterium]|nr:hypothetical protein [Bacteroidales bacterium]